MKMNLRYLAISAIVAVKEYREDQFLVMATRQGSIKKTKLSPFSNPRKGGIVGITLAAPLVVRRLPAEDLFFLGQNLPAGIDLREAAWCGLAKTAFRAACALVRERRNEIMGLLIDWHGSS